MAHLDALTPSTVHAPPGFAAFQRGRIPSEHLAATDAAVIAAGGRIHQHPPIRSRGIETIDGGTSYFIPVAEGNGDGDGEALSGTPQQEP